MENLETKIPAQDLAEIRRLCSQMGGEKQWRRRQVDTYFVASKGRLKLRCEEGQPPQLISYDRPRQEGMRLSRYHLLPVDCGETWKKALADSLGILVEVDKVRELWIYRATRIHLDEVNHLGIYVELETVLRDIDGDTGAGEHRNILEALELDGIPSPGDSYSEMILATSQRAE